MLRGEVRTRPADPGDAAALAGLLNPILQAGGTTALEDPLSPGTLADWFISGPHALICTLAEDDSGLLGFQSLSRFHPLPPGWADVSTFTRQTPRRPGTGTARFAATVGRARAAGLVTLNATIRVDNSGGRAFYARMGFRRHGIRTGIPLRDGTPVDRLHHRLDL